MMVSTGQPHQSADINHENRHPLKAKPLESSQVDRSSGPADIDEETLLLIDENLKKPASRQKKEHSFLKRWWSWFFRNRVLVGLVCLLTGGLIAIGVYFGVIYQQNPVPKPVGICLTPACVLAASEILQNMSPRYKEIDPCSDFDRLVCEGWEEKHDLRADQDSVFTGTVMHENSQQILRHALESLHTGKSAMSEVSSTSEKHIFSKAKETFDACMDEERIKALGSRPLLEILRRIEELSPAAAPTDELSPLQPHFLHQTPRSDGDGNNISATVVFLQKLGVTALVSFSISADDKDPDSVVLNLNAPRRPGLPSKEYYQNEEIVADYSQTIGQVLEALLYEAQPEIMSEKNASSLISADLVKAIVKFESKLAQATPNTEDAEDVTKYYNPRSLEEVDALVPQLSILSIISDLAPQNYSPGQIIVGSPDYLKTLSTELQNTSVETLQAYFVWKTVQAYAYEVEDDALKPLLRFNNQLQGKDPDAKEERWRTCVSVVDNGLGWILSKIFVDKAFSEESKDFGDRIVSHIKHQFIKKLNAAEWMSDNVQKLGIKKVHNIVQKIGFPVKSPDIRNASALEKYYEHVNINSTTFFQNAISIAQFDARRGWSALGKPTDREEWGMTVPTVNAYYNPAGNEIVFPAGIMQAPVFYHPQVPRYLSYGAFGSVSGHELSHAFDSSGRHYDEIGNFTDWWDQDTVDAFTSKAQCFIDQYHEFTIPGPNNEPLHVNGRLTLGENIADAGGLSASFKAWKEHEAKEPAQSLPGLQHFTKEQLFFISYSNFWCGKMRPEAAIDRIYNDPHSPKWARIRGTMANSREFRESFHCNVKKPTCELW